MFIIQNRRVGSQTFLQDDKYYIRVVIWYYYCEDSFLLLFKAYINMLRFVLSLTLYELYKKQNIIHVYEKKRQNTQSYTNNLIFIRTLNLLKVKVVSILGYYYTTKNLKSEELYNQNRPYSQINLQSWLSTFRNELES